MPIKPITPINATAIAVIIDVNKSTINVIHCTFNPRDLLLASPNCKSLIGVTKLYITIMIGKETIVI